jgi:hypothetical protein
MDFSASRPRLLLDTAAAGVTAGVLLICAPSAAAASIAVAPAGTRPSTAVVRLETAMTSGNAFDCKAIPTAPVRYRIGVRRGAGEQAALRVAAQVSHVPKRVRKTWLGGTSRSAELARFWVSGGVLLIGIATFLGVAQWQPRRRRGR